MITHYKLILFYLHKKVKEVLESCTQEQEGMDKRETRVLVGSLHVAIKTHDLRFTLINVIYRKQEIVTNMFWFFLEMQVLL